MSFTAACSSLFLLASIHSCWPKMLVTAHNYLLRTQPMADKYQWVLAQQVNAEGSTLLSLLLAPSVQFYTSLWPLHVDNLFLPSPGEAIPKDDAWESDVQRIPETWHQDTLKTSGVERRAAHLAVGLFRSPSHYIVAVQYLWDSATALCGLSMCTLMVLGLYSYTI